MKGTEGKQRRLAELGDATDTAEAVLREGEVAATVAAAQSAIDIVNAMGEGVILFRLDGTVTAINPAVEALTALGRDEVVGQNLQTLLPRFLEGKDLVMTLRALDEVARGRVPEIKPVVLRSDTAAPATVSPSVAFIKSLKGTPVSVVLTLKDVTELHQTSELLHQIFDNTHLQIVYLDTDFNFVRVNRAYAEACRRDAGFFSGKNHFTLYPHPGNEAIFRGVRESGEPCTVFEKPFEFPDQPERGVSYWDWSLQPIRNEKGVTQGFLLCLLDVTQRVQARRKLVDRERKYRELVENANSIILRITPDQRITFFNEYAQRFFGYPADEVVGRSVVGTIVPETDLEGRNLRKLTEEIAAHPEIHCSSENENMRRDGRRVWVHWSNRALRDQHGVVREILCVGTDITERWRLEKEAETYRKRLRALANRLTETEEQTRRRVAAHIHDTVVQTLALATIRLGGVMAAVEKAGLTEQRERIEGIRLLLDQGTKECRGLMENLVPSLLYEVGLHAALKEFAGKQARTDGTRIIVERDDHGKPMDDALCGLLFQSARELLMNALKYAGRCEIRVSLSSTDGHVQLQVQDTGRGFDPADLDGTASDHAKHGFGLFNIRERLESLGGRLEIATSPGKGTIATVRVPLPDSPHRT